MKIHSMDDCQKWIIYRAYYPLTGKIPLFEIKPDETTKNTLTWHIVDINGKSFQHSEERIINNINIIKENYPKLQYILDNFDIFMCPKPSADTCNACASDHYISYFARSTQIPVYMTDYITGHELGHCVQYNLCSKHGDDNDKFREYLSLRNAPRGMCHDIYVGYDKETDVSIYEDREDFYYLHGSSEERKLYHGEWDTNPAEWFAEDFRYLFGCELGYKDYWGHGSIPPPDDRIKEFMLSL